jgi:tetratricopeptide (TPR) repeat protein
MTEEESDSTRRQQLQAITELLNVVKTGSEEQARRAIRDILRYHKEPAIPLVIRQIDEDAIVETDGVRKLEHSPRWNDLGLAYLAKDVVAALEIFLHLARRELKSPATFNNLGCVFASLRLYDKATLWFRQAYFLDLKAFGPTVADQHPASRNLQLMDKIRGAWAEKLGMKESERVSSPDGPSLILGLSRTQIRSSIITDFLIGGIGAGLFVTIIAAITAYLETATKVSGAVYALLLLMFVVVIVYILYRRAPSEPALRMKD